MRCNAAIKDVISDTCGWRVKMATVKKVWKKLWGQFIKSNVKVFNNGHWSTWLYHTVCNILGQTCLGYINKPNLSVRVCWQIWQGERETKKERNCTHSAEIQPWFDSMYWPIYSLIPSQLEIDKTARHISTYCCVSAALDSN